MDSVSGRLSDHPVLANDIVSVCVTQTRGGHNARAELQRTERPRTRTIGGMGSPVGSSSSASSRSTDDPGPGRRPNFNGSNRFNGNQVDPGRNGNNPFNGNHVDHGHSGLGERGEEAKGENKSLEKLRQVFKCPRFSGQAKDWKTWDKGFQRYLAIWDLDHVLNPSFFCTTPLTERQLKENKLVYYLIEDSTQGSPLAASYVRQAPSQNGFEAYYTLHDGFVFAGATTSTLLLNELSNFRFQQDETPTALIMRLEELFQDLEMLPDGAAMKFNDTQRIGYLLGALRHEKEWATVTSYITSCQLKGNMTFRQACDELKLRCEAEKAFKLMDKEVKGKKTVGGYKAQIQIDEPSGDDELLVDEMKTLISSVSKRLNKQQSNDGPKTPKKIYEKHECIVEGCSEQTTFPVCKLHYHSLVSGKITSLELIKDWGNATYDESSKQVVYPPKVPAAMRPISKPKSKVQ